MKAEQVKDLIAQIMQSSKEHNHVNPNNPVKSIEITSWQECGEWAGEDPRPILKVIFEKITD